jgi:hypothetical protein
MAHKVRQPTAQFDSGIPAKTTHQNALGPDALHPQ